MLTGEYKSSFRDSHLKESRLIENDIEDLSYQIYLIKQKMEFRIVSSSGKVTVDNIINGIDFIHECIEDLNFLDLKIQCLTKELNSRIEEN